MTITKHEHDLAKALAGLLQHWQHLPGSGSSPAAHEAGARAEAAMAAYRERALPPRVTPHCVEQLPDSDSYISDTAALGIDPANWPGRLTTSLGNQRPFELLTASFRRTGDDDRHYAQPDSGLVLRVECSEQPCDAPLLALRRRQA